MKSIYTDHIHYGDGTIYLKKPITFKFKRCVDRIGYKPCLTYKTSIPELELELIEDNIVDVVLDLCDYIHWMYEEFGLEKDEMLTRDAQKIKYNLLEYIDKIVPWEDDEEYKKE